MPIYEYEHKGDPGSDCEQRFEVLQGMSEPPLTCCPECGGPCERVFSSFATIRNEQAILRPKNLERLGFTQFKRAGDGYYEKTCGEGPRVIRGDRD